MSDDRDLKVGGIYATAHTPQPLLFMVVRLSGYKCTIVWLDLIEFDDMHQKDFEHFKLIYEPPT
jgi:hypothetical protein